MLKYFPVFLYIKWKKHSRTVLVDERGRCLGGRLAGSAPAVAGEVENEPGGRVKRGQVCRSGVGALLWEGGASLQGTWFNFSWNNQGFARSKTKPKRKDIQ